MLVTERQRREIYTRSIILSHNISPDNLFHTSIHFEILLLLLFLFFYLWLECLVHDCCLILICHGILISIISFVVRMKIFVYLIRQFVFVFRDWQRIYWCIGTSLLLWFSSSLKLIASLRIDIWQLFRINYMSAKLNFCLIAIVTLHLRRIPRFFVS